jgi:exodeoxyribonuclease V alpha subunit
VHGGVKFYRGSPGAARSYVEADRSRVDDYYLAEGTGLAERYVATPPPEGVRLGVRDVEGGIRAGGTLDGPAYERWVAGYDVETGAPKGGLRRDKQGLRFVEVVVNGPKTWSLAAALHPEIAAAYDAAQDKAAAEIIGWLAEHATTRVGPRGRQVQVPVEQLEAAIVRHYTSRAGDPHRHLHLQINARVYAAGAWRGLHSVGVVDSIEAINGIGHAAVICDPEFRGVLAAHGYTLDPKTGEVAQLAPYAGSFSARAAQITRNIDRYEAQWRSEHPDEEPGPTLRRAWDRRAWAQARPDKVVPESGAELRQRWVDELYQLGFTPPTVGVEHRAVPIGRVKRDAVVDLVLSRLAARRSSWNAADIRGQVERIIASAGIVAQAPVRRELVEDLTERTVARCVPLLARDDVPQHVRSLTSRRVLDVEADLIGRLASRAEQPSTPYPIGSVVARRRLDPAQRQVVAALGGTAELLVIQGAAGAGKTTSLAAASGLLAMQEKRLLVVTPTLKAAQVAQEEVGAAAFTSAWLVHQHGFRWDEDGHWSRNPVPRDALSAHALLLPGDLLLVDEAGMLDQDVARALLTIADETGARIALVGDRHQLPAVGRGGGRDHAARYAPPEACLELGTVHRFTDPEYADLTMLMRTGQTPGEVFDMLQARGLIQIHPTEVERLAALTDVQGTVIADTREQVATLNAVIRDSRLATDETRAAGAVTTAAGERVSVGDQIATRRNDRDLEVANRDRWTVTGTDGHGALVVRGRGGARTLPAEYVRQHVELAYATTAYGAQGETVDQAHLLIGEGTAAAAVYVGMTRGRNRNTAHLVAETLEEARAQWVDVFSRDRADLGPRHAAQTAAEDINRYGPQAAPRATELDVHTPHRGPRRQPQPFRTSPGSDRSPGIGR